LIKAGTQKIVMTKFVKLLLKKVKISTGQNEEKNLLKIQPLPKSFESAKTLMVFIKPKVSAE
jgi:hypothetical protein